MAHVESRAQEIEEDSRNGQHRDGEYRPGQAGDLAPADHGEDHEDRVDPDGLPVHPRRQHVALELLYDEERKGC
jgi:hypothetical protein